jgi:hypothetical protein
MLDKSSVEKILDRAPLALILIGVLIFIMGAAGGLPIGNPPLTVSDSGWRIGLGIVGVVLFVIGIMFLWKETTNEGKNRPSSTKEFKTLSESTSLLCDIASKEKEKLTIEIVAATGGTTISTILPSIIKNTSAPKIEISIFLVNKESPMAMYFPNHWAKEVDIVIDKIKQDWSNNPNPKVTSFNVYLYDFLPTLHGVMLNNKHLVFGFFGWKHFSGGIQLSGAEASHRYYSKEKHPDSQFIIDMFDDWVENMPSKKVYTLPKVSKRA